MSYPHAFSLSLHTENYFNKTMNKHIKLLRTIVIVSSLLLAPVLTSSCKDDSGSEVEKVTDSVNLVGDATFATNTDGSQSISATFKSSGEPTVTADADWISITSVNNKSEGYYTLTASASANTTADDRAASITIACGTASASISVLQKGVVEPDDDSIISKMGMGWNLGNQFDAYNDNVASETAWGNKAATQATMDALYAAGIRTVRIPVTWLGHVGDEPSYTIESAWLDRVAEVVSYAENAGLCAIINIHHDGADSKHWLSIKDAANSNNANTRIKAQLNAMWTQIANKFADKGDFLIFEAMNEIHDGGWGWGNNRNDGNKQYGILNEWNQVFVDAVRATGGKNATRWLGVPGYCTNPDLTISYLTLPTDEANRVMVAVHDYDPYEYTLNDTYNAWGHLADKSKGDTTNGSNEEKVITSTFSQLKEKFIDNGIPVYIGEIGCVRRATNRAESFRKYYLEYVCKAAKTYGLAPVFWDNGGTGTGKEQSGLFDHSTGEYLNDGEEVVKVMVNAIENTDAAYTLESVYNNAKIED